MQKKAKKTIHMKDSELKVTSENIASVVKAELGDDYNINVSLRRPKIQSEAFIMIYQEIGKKILEGDISLSAVKLFYYMANHMQFENFIGIDLKTISENIKMPLSTVKEAMRDIKDMGLVISIKDNFDNRRNVYRINPVVAWKGKVKNKKKIAIIDPAQTAMFENENLPVNKMIVSKKSGKLTPNPNV